MRIGFIGTGNMNGAILRGIIDKGYDPSQIWITNRTMCRAEQYADTGVNIVASSEEVIAETDVIILGMKPNDYKPWLESYSYQNKTLISIGAGITSQFMAEYTDNFIITMPNTPSKVGFGSTLVVRSDVITTEILAIFEAIGKVHIIPEQDLDKYTLVTGCSPAYFFNFVANMSDVLVAEYDLDKTTVNEMLIQVMSGASKMLMDDPNPHQLCDNVCSPGGVTIEVVNHLNNDLPTTFKNGFADAINRTNEMKNEK